MSDTPEAKIAKLQDQLFCETQLKNRYQERADTLAVALRRAEEWIGHIHEHEPGLCAECDLARKIRAVLNDANEIDCFAAGSRNQTHE